VAVVRPADDAREGDRRMLEQGVLDVTREDVEAAADDQIIFRSTT